MEALKLSSAGTFSSKMEYHPVAQAVGNFSECRSAAKMLLQKKKDKCLYTRCLLGSTFIPKLKGRFIATENFFYTSKFFGLDSTSYLSDLILAGEEFCEEDWRKLKKKYPDLEEEELLRYCFSSAYIVALLHDSLGIGINDRRIEFANQVGGIPLDWALGAFIIQKMGNQNAESSNWVAAIFFDDSSAYLSLSVVSVAILFTAWSVSKWRKPQLKTIYDLEKGRYIMTRIKR
ncbi:putative apyrase 6 [Iris pallida]|uniref:Apyrase 6 n=1 Tax=Iris pallida TaxID=29817 RepID=A0AAX6F6Z9_IRIPA|nr:putative apyrase 6 [Iris pallida]